mgnify:CR=1 FL=1
MQDAPSLIRPAAGRYWRGALRGYRNALQLLATENDDAEVEFSDGVTVRRLREIVEFRVIETADLAHEASAQP